MHFEEITVNCNVAMPYQLRSCLPQLPLYLYTLNTLQIHALTYHQSIKAHALLIIIYVNSLPSSSPFHNFLFSDTNILPILSPYITLILPICPTLYSSLQNSNYTSFGTIFNSNNKLCSSCIFSFLLQFHPHHVNH